MLPNGPFGSQLPCLEIGCAECTTLFFQFYLEIFTHKASFRLRHQLACRAGPFKSNTKMNKKAKTDSSAVGSNVHAIPTSSTHLWMEKPNAKTRTSL